MTGHKSSQESLDGIRENAMRAASVDEMGASSSAKSGQSRRRCEIDKTRQAKEIVRARVIVSSITKEGDIAVGCDSKAKLWKDVDLKKAMQNWNMKYVDIVRSPESALTVFTTSERLANQMKINENWRSWTISEGV